MYKTVEESHDSFGEKQHFQAWPERISDTVVLDQVAVSKHPGAFDKSRSRMQLLQDLPFSCVWLTRLCFQGSQI